jgi:Na+-driven multidrug efflux pump
MANAAVSGNLLGCGEADDAFRSGIITGTIGVALITVLTVIVVRSARPIAMLLSGNEIVVRECVRYIYISMISEPFMAWAVILSGALSGAGDTRSVMMIVVFGYWLVRIPLAFLLGIVAGWGPTAVWWAMNASIFTHAFFVTLRYFRRKWLEL